MTLRDSLEKLLQAELDSRALDYWQLASAEIGAGVTAQRFAALLALASRYARRQPLAHPGLAAGFNPTAWNRLELLRVALILARPDLSSDAFAGEFEALFRFADEGETCALYRALPLLPAPERFVWRAGEACRSNMLSVFAAVALDSPYPVTYFDDTAWHQLVMKAVFVEAPLERIEGLDSRLSPELTRMALDFAAERLSAGRRLIPGFWLLPGSHQPEAVAVLVERLWPQANTKERQAMALGLGRAGRTDSLKARQHETNDTTVLGAIEAALAGDHSQQAFARLLAAH